MTYVVREIEAFTGNQIIIWLQDEATGNHLTESGSSWCVRVTVDEAPGILASLVAAYATSMQNIAIDLAAGGCRNCGNERRVGVNHLSKLMGGAGGGQPCPVCMPRAEKRLRKYMRRRR